MTSKIIGNVKTLLSMHGTLDINDAIVKICSLTELEEIDIDYINKKSESGGLYIEANGRILDTYNKYDESRAKYKLVPLGLNLRHTEYPLMASFIHINSSWEGALIGTAVQLFELYKKQCINKNNFDNTYELLFGGLNKIRQIKGFGLSSLTANIDDVTLDEKCNTDNILELTQGIEKLERKGKLNNKEKRKLERLKTCLNKLKQIKEREGNKEVEEVEQSTIDSAHFTEFNILWLKVDEPESSIYIFEDDETKAFHKRIEAYINGDKQYDNIEIEESIEETSSVIVEIEEEIAKGQTLEEEIAKGQTLEEEIAKGQTLEDKISNEQDILKLLENSNLLELNTEKYNNYTHPSVISDIHTRLLFKEAWTTDNRGHLINKLSFYLIGLFLGVWQDKKSNKGLRGNGYTLSELKDKAVVNTGLLDIYGNYIYIVDHTPDEINFNNKKVSLMQNKLSLIDYGFRLKDIRYLPNPIKLYKDTSELIFDGNIDDFDLDDVNHLKHIIYERISRFPKKYKQESAISLCSKLRAAIVQAIQISKSDYRYIIPKYDFKRQMIQFVIPFYLDKHLDESPELAIIVGKQQGIWNIYTILDVDSAYSDVALVCPPYRTWLDSTSWVKGANNNLISLNNVNSKQIKSK